MTNPLVIPETYIRAETDRTFYNASQLTGGVDSLFSFRQVTPLDRQTVVRMNKDGSYTIRFNSPGKRKPLPGPFFFRSLSYLPAFGPIFLLDKVFFFNYTFSLKIKFLSNKNHSSSASGRESRLFLRNTESPIKAFGEDEEVPVVTIKRQGKGRRK